MSEETYDTEYIKGFNAGYIMAKHMSDLATKISAARSSLPRMQGFKRGRLEYRLEAIKMHTATRRDIPFRVPSRGKLRQRRGRGGHHKPEI